MKFLKQSTNIQYVIAKLTLPKSTCRPPQIPFHKGILNQKKHGTTFQVTIFIECFDKDIFKRKYPSVALQILKNHKFLFYLKMKPHMKIFLTQSVLSHVMDTLFNIFSQNLI